MEDEVKDEVDEACRELADIPESACEAGCAGDRRRQCAEDRFDAILCLADDTRSPLAQALECLRPSAAAPSTAQA